MRKKTKKALDKSILHWGDNLSKAKAGALTLLDISNASCALCDRFYNHTECTRSDGERCPVYLKTELQICRGSPWISVASLICGGQIGERYQLIESVERELAFLERLTEGY